MEHMGMYMYVCSSMENKTSQLDHQLAVMVLAIGDHIGAPGSKIESPSPEAISSSQRPVQPPQSSYLAESGGESPVMSQI